MKVSDRVPPQPSTQIHIEQEAARATQPVWSLSQEENVLLLQPTV